MSFKKKSKKSSGSGGLSSSGNPRTPSILLGAYPASSPGTTSRASGEQGTLDGSRAKLLELFGQIEQQFELLHGENTACKYLSLWFTAPCCVL